MDFIKGLPHSGHANCILVVVDKFSKFTHFLPLLHPLTATSVAKVFLDNNYRLHGMPSHIISDRDRIFPSSFWLELFKLAKTTLCMSLAYHPQSDGQTKRVNQCLETYLRCFVHACSGSPWPSSGITPVGTLLWIDHPLRFYTGILLAILACPLNQRLIFLNWTPRCKSMRP